MFEILVCVIRIIKCEGAPCVSKGLSTKISNMKTHREERGGGGGGEGYSKIRFV